MKTAHVFIADDDITICELLVKILLRLKCCCHYAHSVKESLRLLLANSFYDVYLLDYILEDGTGLEIAHFLRYHECDKPIILISGYDTGALELEVEALGILSVIKKPFTAQSIYSQVSQALG
jgi:DNA-binding NtrC family response regulator